MVKKGIAKRKKRRGKQSDEMVKKRKNEKPVNNQSEALRL